MSNMVMAYSKNQKAAKDFLRWITSKEAYQVWFNSQQGYSVGATTVWENDPLWKQDPVMLPFRSAARSGRFPGYADRQTDMRPRYWASTSSSTCTPRRCRACGEGCGESAHKAVQAVHAST
jgi:ABC-type glycerol-3-phosphate transport system substrate-binding protein